MEWERVQMHASVREGYQVLLRADAELFVPLACEKIAAYYRALAEKSLAWICEVYGEDLRKQFLAVEDVRERARFGTRRYSFSMQCVWENGAHAAFLCEGILSGENEAAERTRRRSAAVWNLENEQLLPRGQVEKMLLAKGEKKRPPFACDGMYPCNEALIYFKNPTREGEGAEWQIPLSREVLL